MLSAKMAGKPDWVVTGRVEAPPAKASTLLLRFDEGRVTADSVPLIATTYRRLWKGDWDVYVRGGPREYYASIGQENSKDVLIEVDRANGSVAMKGHWWYGGTHTIEPHDGGSLITHRVWNIAPGVSRVAVPMLNRGFGKQMQVAMQDLLKLIGDRLHVRTQLER